MSISGTRSPYVARTWVTHNGRSRNLRHLTYHAETTSGKVFSGSSMFKVINLAEKYEQARIAMRGE